MYASRNDNSDAVEALLHAGADVNIIDNVGILLTNKLSLKI